MFKISNRFMLRSKLGVLLPRGSKEEAAPETIDEQSLGDVYVRTRMVRAKDRPYVSSILKSTTVIAQLRRQKFKRHGLYCSQLSTILRVAIQVFHDDDGASSLLVNAGIVLTLSIGLCPCTSSSENQLPCRP